MKLCIRHHIDRLSGTAIRHFVQMNNTHEYRVLLRRTKRRSKKKITNIVLHKFKIKVADQSGWNKFVWMENSGRRRKQNEPLKNTRISNLKRNNSNTQTSSRFYFEMRQWNCRSVNRRASLDCSAVLWSLCKSYFVIPNRRAGRQIARLESQREWDEYIYEYLQNFVGRLALYHRDSETIKYVKKN